MPDPAAPPRVIPIADAGSGRRKLRSALKGRVPEPQALAEVRALLGVDPRRRDLLIEYLHRIQDAYGHIAAAHLVALAAELKLAMSEVYEVATFYFMFNTKPIGRFHLQVCGTTPCWLRGSDAVLKACKDAGGLKGYGDTSADGNFTLSEVECLGGCVNAPILAVDDDYYEDLDYDSTVKLIEALKRGERPAPGSVIGRQTSAPVGGPTTLLDVAGE